MGVLLITEMWPPKIGGVENYLKCVATYLGKAGEDVTVIAPKIAGGGREDESNEKNLEGVKEKRKKFFCNIVRPKWWFFYRWIRRKTKQNKVEMVLCGKALFEGIVGYLLKKKYGIPYVVFTYAMEIEEWKKNRWQRIKLKKALKGADKVICINEVTKQSLLELGVDKSKVVKAWPGVSEKMLKEVSKKQVREVLDKYEVTQPYVVSVGRLIERKGFDLLIEAFSRIDQTKFGNTKLVIVGDGPLLDGLQDDVEGELLDTSVIFLPDVPDEELRALYAGAHLFALTPKQQESDIEGFGIVYLEAAAQRVPSIATNTGGVPEAVVDGGTGIVVESENVDAICKAMERILSDNEFRNKLGERGKQRVWEQFRWEERIKPILEIVRQRNTGG
jgi:phosphatidylinositol alpha-1,6-mannosyltransferase